MTGVSAGYRLPRWDRPSASPDPSQASDVYEDFESDERVLNSATGHRSSDTRRKKYQQRDRPEILAKTAETRRRVRSEAFGRQSLNGDAGPAT